MPVAPHRPRGHIATAGPLPPFAVQTMRRIVQRSAGIVLVHRDGGEHRYLLLRSALTRRPIWEFPKGGIEAGESELQAARRELCEEAGLAPPDFLVMDGFREREDYVFTRGTGPDRLLVMKQVLYFAAEARSEEIRISDEADAYRWCTFAEARALLRFPGKRRVLERAETFLSGAENAAPAPSD